MHTAKAAVFARTVIASPAPDSRTYTRFSPGFTDTVVAGPVDKDYSMLPSVLAR